MSKKIKGIILIVALGWWSESCIANRKIDDVSTPDEFKVEKLSIYDWSGRPCPKEAIARRVTIELKTSQTVDGANHPALLFAGATDDELFEDLTQAPLRMSDLQREVESDIRYLEDRITITPRDPLEADSIYTVAVAGWAQSTSEQDLNGDGSPFVGELTVSRKDDAGASAVASWPADGTAGAAPNLDFAAVQFDGEISGAEKGVWLQDPEGLSWPASVDLAPCRQIGWSDGQCAIIAPAANLAPDTDYKIVVGSKVRDARGAPSGLWSADFHTAAEADRESSSWLPMHCYADELAVEAGCALIDDRSITLRILADEPVRLRLKAPQNINYAVAPRGEAQLIARDLPPDSRVNLELIAADLAGNQTTAQLDLRTASPLAKLSITEVRADPFGPEPAQEYVELLNWGDTPVDLQGYSISDDPDDVGKSVAQSVLVHPGARVLLVSDRFDPDDPRDDAPPPGAALIRIGSSLASAGLSNSGEPLFLRDPSGKRISAAPASPRPRSGVCIVRVAEDMRDGSDGSFAYDPDNHCTPGE